MDKTERIAIARAIIENPPSGRNYLEPEPPAWTDREIKDNWAANDGYTEEDEEDE